MSKAADVHESFREEARGCSSTFKLVHTYYIYMPHTEIRTYKYPKEVYTEDHCKMQHPVECPVVEYMDMAGSSKLFAVFLYQKQERNWPLPCPSTCLRVCSLASLLCRSQRLFSWQCLRPRNQAASIACKRRCDGSEMIWSLALKFS